MRKHLCGSSKQGERCDRPQTSAGAICARLPAMADGAIMNARTQITGSELTSGQAEGPSWAFRFAEYVRRHVPSEIGELKAPGGCLDMFDLGRRRATDQHRPRQG